MSNQLSDSEERFRGLVMATSDFVYRMSPDWRSMRQLIGGSFLTEGGSKCCENPASVHYKPDRSGHAVKRRAGLLFPRHH